MIDAPHLKTDRPATSGRAKRELTIQQRRLYQPNERRHEHQGRCWAHPIRFCTTAGQVGGYTGAAALLDRLRLAEWFPA
jgi:hypothetical protein